MDLTGRLKNGRFKKGHIPFNKGKKGLNGTSSTVFKKGHIPHNFKDVGSIRYPKFSHDYVMIKIKNPNKWIPYHIYIYEKENGKLPPNSVIVFLDGNNRNFNKENLFLITKQELLAFNKMKIKPCKEAILIARLKVKNNKMKKELENEKNNRLNRNIV